MAGRIPDKFIDELLVRVDIIDVIDSRVPLKKAGKEYKACCPFHDEKTPSFTVSQSKQFYHCFGCGAHGTAIGFLMEYERMSFPEAVRDLAGRVGMSVPEEAQVDEDRQRQSTGLLELLAEADHYFRQQLREHPQAQQAVDYLKGRGLSGEIAASFGIGYAPDGWDNLLTALGTNDERREGLAQAGLLKKKDSGGFFDFFRQRVMFPIQDYRGRIVGFGGRVLGEGEPKYLNTPETPVFHKGREAYGLYRARDAIRREQRVLVVEGYMDVVALAQFGVDYAVATLGTATTREHLERLFRYAPEVVFAFDGDRAGRDAAWRALEIALPVIEAGRQIGFMFLPEGEDPDTLIRKEGPEAFGLRVRQAQPLPEYLEETLRSQVDMSRLDGRSRFLELARPMLEKIPAGIFRDLLVQRLGEVSRASPEMLSKLLGFQASPASTTVRPAKSARPTARQLPKQPNVMRRAIGLLVQYPRLAGVAGHPAEFAGLEIAGAALFAELVQVLQESPGLNTGGLLERYRETEHFGPLQKLAQWTDISAERPDDERDLETEFSDTLARLRVLGVEARLAALDSQIALNGPLRGPEAEEYRKLLQQKQELRTSGGLPETGKAENLD